MTIYFDGAGMKAEALAQKQFNGVLATEKRHQYKDIDLFVKGKDKKWRSVSIKDQLYSSGKYGGVQIETQLTNTRTKATMKGCFYSNEADYYFWRVSIHGCDSWLVIPCSVMKRYVEDNLNTLKTWTTRANTEEKNRAYGRVYDKASGVTIPVLNLLGLGKVIAVSTGEVGGV